MVVHPEYFLNGWWPRSLRFADVIPLYPTLGQGNKSIAGFYYSMNGHMFHPRLTGPFFLVLFKVYFKIWMMFCVEILIFRTKNSISSYLFASKTANFCELNFQRASNMAFQSGNCKFYDIVIFLSSTRLLAR